MATQPVARVTLTNDSGTRTSEYNSLFLSDTNRNPYTAVSVTASQRAALGAESGATVEMYSDKADLTTLGDFGKEGAEIDARNAAAARGSATTRPMPRLDPVTIAIGKSAPKNSTQSLRSHSSFGSNLRTCPEGEVRHHSGIVDQISPSRRRCVNAKETSVSCGGKPSLWGCAADMLMT